MNTSFMFDKSEFEPENLNNTPLNALPLAMAYLPLQKWQQLYEPEVALQRGTLFSQLDLPFLGKKADSR